MNAEPTRVRYAVVGIGINVNQQKFSGELSERATSLRIAGGGGAWPRVALTGALLQSLDREYRAVSPAADVIRRFSERSSYARGKQVHVEEHGGYDGVTAGLDERAVVLKGETRDRLADSFEGMGKALDSRGKLNQAQNSCNQALELREALFKLDPRNARYRSHLGFNYVSLSDIYVKQRKWNKALESYKKAIAIIDAMSTADPINWLLLRARADAYSKLGDVEGALASTFRVEDQKHTIHALAARSWYKRSLALWSDMKTKGTLDPPHARTPAELTRKIAYASRSLSLPALP